VIGIGRIAFEADVDAIAAELDLPLRRLVGRGRVSRQSEMFLAGPAVFQRTLEGLRELREIALAKAQLEVSALRWHHHIRI